MVRWEDKPRTELERAFVEAYERLVQAGTAFDARHLSEAPNIAKEAMNFIYDSGQKSESILQHLGIKHTINFVDSSKPSAIASLPSGSRKGSNEYRLIDEIIGFSGMDYRPLLGTRTSPRMIPFAAWWDGTVLSRYVHAPVERREKISRGELVQHVRNEEGGGHVSARYKRGTPADKMARLMQGEYVDGYMQLNGESPLTAEDHAPAYATIRQIGWELEETLRQARPDLTSRADFNPRPGPRMRPAPPEKL